MENNMYHLPAFLCDRAGLAVCLGGLALLALMMVVFRRSAKKAAAKPGRLGAVVPALVVTCSLLAVMTGCAYSKAPEASDDDDMQAEETLPDDEAASSLPEETAGQEAAPEAHPEKGEQGEKGEKLDGEQVSKTEAAIDMVIVPNFVNMTEADARSLAESLGLEVLISRLEVTPDGSQSLYYITDQSIPEASEVRRGTRIELGRSPIKWTTAISAAMR